MSRIIEELLNKARQLPESPGCYLMKNRAEKIIYVGKAKNLRSRVSSYFQKSEKTLKTEFLVSHIQSFDFLMTANESEALVLENNLIKKHNPKYNIHLRDDKTYPYVRVDLNNSFPRPEYVRRVKKEANKKLFGPWPSGTNLYQILRLITKTYQLRDCSDSEMKRRTRPCLLHQMHQCSAPCVGLITASDYREQIERAMSFFKDKKSGQKELKRLAEQMHSYADNEEFEMAAILRDGIAQLEEFVSHEGQKNAELLQASEAIEDIDIVNYFEGETEVDISLYSVRRGILIGHKNFHFPVADYFDELESSVMSYMLQYYTESGEKLPKLLIAPFNTENLELLTAAIHSQVDGKIKVKGPSKKLKELSLLAYQHAKETQRIRNNSSTSPLIGLTKLQDLLELKERPKVLECFDVAIWQGKSPTASQVVFIEGVPEKKNYRHYHLEERPEGNNDFAMMKELFTRRLQKDDFPDVFVVDGGVAQVNTVALVLKECGVDIPVVGIAKARTLKEGKKFQSKEIERSEERLIIHGRINPYTLEKSPSLYRILVQMRDEAHRFSRRLHHKQEETRIFHSWWDEIEGIGEKTKMKLQSLQINNKEEVATMSLKDLMEKFELKESTALKIYRYFNN